MMKLYTYILPILALLIFSGCGSKRHIDVNNYKPNSQEIQYKEPVTMNVTHGHGIWGFTENIYSGLKSYLNTHAKNITLTSYPNNQNPRVLNLKLTNVRDGVTVKADVKSNITLSDNKGNRIINDKLFISQGCLNGQQDCKRNERYNIGLLNGKMLLEALANNPKTYSLMVEEGRRIKQMQDSQKAQAELNKELEENNMQKIQDIDDEELKKKSDMLLEKLFN